MTNYLFLRNKTPCHLFVVKTNKLQTIECVSVWRTVKRREMKTTFFLKYIHLGRVLRKVREKNYLLQFMCVMNHKLRFSYWMFSMPVTRKYSLFSRNSYCFLFMFFFFFFLNSHFYSKQVWLIRVVYKSHIS